MDISEIKYISMYLASIARDMEYYYRQSIDLRGESNNPETEAYRQGWGAACDEYGCKIATLAERLELAIKETEE